MSHGPLGSITMGHTNVKDSKKSAYFYSEQRAQRKLGSSSTELFQSFLASILLAQNDFDNEEERIKWETC